MNRGTRLGDMSCHRYILLYFHHIYIYLLNDSFQLDYVYGNYDNDGRPPQWPFIKSQIRHASLVQAMHPDIDHADEYVRNTTAHAFSVVASALGIPSLLPFLNSA
jgi:hypothetical protein